MDLELPTQKKITGAHFWIDKPQLSLVVVARNAFRRRFQRSYPAEATLRRPEITWASFDASQCSLLAGRADECETVIGWSSQKTTQITLHTTDTILQRALLPF